MAKRLLFVADSTSQLRPAWLVAKHLGEALGLSVRCNIIPNESIRAQSQLDEIGVGVPTTNWSIASLVDQPHFFESDVVVAFLAASRIFRLRRHVELSLARRPRPSRPLLVTGYNGVVFEKHLEGLAWRLGYDFICVNSKRDERIFSEYLTALGRTPETLVRTGLPLAQFREAPTLRQEDDKSGSLLFATQHIVPMARQERVYLVRALAQLARTRPDRRIIIKPRSAPGQQTLHKEKYHYEVLLKEEIKRPPRNLVVEYGALSDFFPTTSLLATVSSTAALEALSQGIPAAILTDLGIKESLGNHFFVGSGMLSTLRDLRTFQAPVPNSSWLDDNGLGGAEDLSQLVSAVEFALKEKSTSKQMRPLSPAFYGPETAPGLEQLVMWSSPNAGSGSLPARTPADLEAKSTGSDSIADRIKASLRQITEGPHNPWRRRGP